MLRGPNSHQRSELADVEFPVSLVAFAKRLENEGVAHMDDIARMLLLHMSEDPGANARVWGLSDEAVRIATRPPNDAEVASARLIAVAAAFAASELTDDSALRFMTFVGMTAARFPAFFNVID